MINNQSELDKAIALQVSIALGYAIDKLLDELKGNIDRIVYGAGSPNYYERTMEFEKSWETSKPVIKGKFAEAELFQNPMSMSLDRDNYTHGSNYPKANDVREGLADIIFNGESGLLFGEGFWTQARDAWTPTVECLDNGKFMAWFNEGMRLRI